MEKTVIAFESFKNIQDLIKFADQKSSAVLVVAGLIFTGYFQFLEGLMYTRNFNFLGICTFLTSLATAVSLVMVVYITIFKVLKPRTAEHYSQNNLSLFYYEHILQMGKEKVSEQYANITTEVILKNIIDQQFEISSILNKKTVELSLSLNWLFASIISMFIFILLVIQF
jgi:hypothetical protein